MREPIDDATSSGRLTVTLSTAPNGLVLTLTGELDLETAPELDRTLASLEASPTLDRLIIDLSGVEFIDSTGLRSILLAQRSADSNGHSLAVRDGSDQVQRLFALTGMHERLTFDENT